jgi:hypothetical protein
MARQVFRRSRAALARLGSWIIDGFWIQVGDLVYPSNPYFVPMVDTRDGIRLPGSSRDGNNEPVELPRDAHRHDGDRLTLR